MTRASLLIIDGIEQGSRFELEGESAGIGRGPQNTIRILDSEASRTHARIDYRDRKYLLTDLESSNGTVLNGKLIRSHELKSSDRIQIGRTVILFTTAPEEASTENDVARRISLVNPTEHDDSNKIVGPTVPGDFTVFDPVKTDTPLAIAQSLNNLQVLYRITEEASSPHVSINELLQRILNQTLSAVGAERGCILVRQPASGELIPTVYSPNLGQGSSPMPVSRSIVDYVFRSKQGVRTSDARTDQRFTPGQSILQGGIREAMCVPMQGRYNLTGVIYVDTTTPPEHVILSGGLTNRFNEETLKLLVAIGRQTALAVEDSQYQQALVKAERLAAIGQTIATLSHHIKNILQGVRGGSYLIEMGIDGNEMENVRKGWRIVEKNQNRIYNLVMDMLTFSKERQPAFRLAQLNETIADVVELTQNRAAEMHVGVKVNLSQEVPSSLFDVEGIHRAVLNIVTNAFDAIEGQPNAQIDIGTAFEKQTRMLLISVIDNGPGIPDDQLPRIFNLFESTKGARGTGIGLSVSQKIIREHGGDIEVETSPNAGCHFLIRVPLIEESSEFHESRTLA